MEAYLRWVRRPAPHGHSEASVLRVDAHHIREPRSDDQAFFALLGPGKQLDGLPL